MNRIIRDWLRGTGGSGPWEMEYGNVSQLAQQALSVAEKALTVITEHKDYCERANDERVRRDVDRDQKVEQLHKENLRQRESDNEAARKRWFATMGVMATMIIGLATFIIENWHK